MKNETIEKLLNLTPKEKWEGVYLSDDGELYLGWNNKPHNFTGECKSWYRNGHINVHSRYKNNMWDGECKKWNIEGNLYYHVLYKDDKIIKNYLK